jgi:hypothetical protein
MVSSLPSTGTASLRMQYAEAIPIGLNLDAIGSYTTGDRAPSTLIAVPLM